MTQTNGHDLIKADTIEDIAIASQANSAAVAARVSSTTAFEHHAHELMIGSVDKITQEWVDEMTSLRKNSEAIEQMVIEQATKVKSELTKLHLLGVQAMRESQRGHELLQHLGDEIDAMMNARH